MDRETLRGKVQTVRGLIVPDALGPTLMHEHLLCDVTQPGLAAADGEEVNALNALLIEKGLLTRATHMIMLSPPLCITRAEVDRMVGIIDDALTAFEKQFSYC